MVEKNKFYLVILIVFVVLSASFVLGLKDLAGDIPTEVSCASDSDCKVVCTNASFLIKYSVSTPPPKPEEVDCICHKTEKFCYDTGLPPSWVGGVNNTNKSSTQNQTKNESGSIVNLNQKIDTKVKEIETTQKKIEAGVSTLEIKSIDFDQRISTLEGNYKDLTDQIGQLNTNIQTLNSMQVQAKDELKQDVNKVATGLAIAQNTLDTTQKNLSSVQQQLEEETGSRQFLSYTFFGLLILAIALGAIYFVTTRGSSKEAKKTQQSIGVSEEIVDYISKGLKSGKKYVNLKDNLMKVGWAAEEIENGFKEAARKSFPRTVQQSPGVKVAVNAPRQVRTQAAGNKNKVMAMVGIVFIVLSVILVVMFSKSSGQAIYYKQLVGGKENGTAGEITYSVDCTPPHILLPSKNGCCLDRDNNKVCDYLEKEQVKRRAAGTADMVEADAICIETAQCKNGLTCVNSRCSNLNNLYKGTGDCSKICNYYTVGMLTSDKETYNVKPNEGSYTAAGAVEWRVLEAPVHCKGEPALVPIEIIKKKPGEIISDEVITLSKGQSSNAITHPEIDGLLFTLKVKDIHELCSE